MNANLRAATVFRADRGFLVILLLLALALRAARPDLMEWKHDEAVAWVRARAMLEGLAFPQTGLVSSQGVENFPLFLWILALLQIVCRAPDTLVWPIALLNSLAVFPLFGAVRRLFDRPTAWIAAILYVVSPCAVFFSRKIWAQDIMPFWSCALFWCATRMIQYETPANSKRVSPWPSFFFALLAATSFQVHFSALFLCLAYAVTFTIYRKSHHLRSLIAGLAIGLLPTLPYFFHQAAAGWEGLHITHASLNNAVRWRPRDLVLFFLRQPADENFHLLLGPEYPAFLRDLPGYQVVRYGLSVLTLVGIAILFVKTMQSQSTARGYAGFLLLLIGMGLTALLLARVPLIPAYFIIFYPIPFLLAALPLAELSRIVACRSSRRWAIAGLSITCLVISAYQIAFSIAFLARVATRGGTAGGYGPVYAQTRAAARWMAKNSSSVAQWQYAELPILACVTVRDKTLLKSSTSSIDGAPDTFAILHRLIYPHLDPETEAWVIGRSKAYYYLTGPVRVLNDAEFKYPPPPLTPRQELEAVEAKQIALELLNSR